MYIPMSAEDGTVNIGLKVVDVPALGAVVRVAS